MMLFAQIGPYALLLFEAWNWRDATRVAPKTGYFLKVCA